MYKHFDFSSQSYLIVFLLFLPWKSVAQSDTVNVSQLTIQIDRLNVRIDSLQNTIDSLTVNNKADIIDKASQKLQQQQDNFNATTDKALDYFGIALAVTGVILPLIYFIYGLITLDRQKKQISEALAQERADNNKVLEEIKKEVTKSKRLNQAIKNKLKKKFDQFITKKKKEEIDEAIQNINSDDHYKSKSAKIYLKNNQQYNYSYNQLLKLINILRSFGPKAPHELRTIEGTTRTAIQNIVYANTYTDKERQSLVNEYSMQVVLDAVRNKGESDHEDFWRSYGYLSKPELYKKLVEKIANTELSTIENLEDFLLKLIPHKAIFLIGYLNNKNIVSKIDDGLKLKLKTAVETKMDEGSGTLRIKTYFANTILYKSKEE